MLLIKYFTILCIIDTMINSIKDTLYHANMYQCIFDPEFLEYLFMFFCAALSIDALLFAPWVVLISISKVLYY